MLDHQPARFQALACKMQPIPSERAGAKPWLERSSMVCRHCLNTILAQEHVRGIDFAECISFSVQNLLSCQKSRKNDISLSVVTANHH